MSMSDDPASFTFLWSIEHFASCSSTEMRGIITHPDFVADSLEGSAWWLKIHPRSDRDPGYAAVHLCRGAGGPESVRVIHEVSFLKSDGTPHLTPKVAQSVKEGEEVEMENCPRREDIFETESSAFLPDGTLTVRLRLWRQDGAVEKSEHHSLRTKITWEKFGSNTFSIHNFSLLRLSETNVGRACLGHPASVALELYVNGRTIQGAALDIRVTSKSIYGNYLYCKLSVVDRLGGLLMSRKKQTRSACPAFPWEFPEFVTRQEILENKKDVLPGDVLSLICEFFVMNCVHEEMASIGHETE